MIPVGVEAAVDRHLPADAFALLADFARYPQYADVVQEVRVRRLDGETVESQWWVRFRTGILHWTEVDRIDPRRLVIDFRQSAGDLARFEGSWSVHPAVRGARVVFQAEADLGIPTLAALLDPTTERTLRETIRAILVGLLGPDVSFDAEDALARKESLAGTGVVTGGKTSEAGTRPRIWSIGQR